MFLTQTLHRQLQQRPESLALIDSSGQSTWAEFVDRVARIAAGLRAHGVEAGDRVGIVSENSNRVVEHAYACPWAGAVVCPINFRWTVAEMAVQVDDAEIEVLFAGSGFLDTALELKDRCPSLRLIVDLSADGTRAADSSVVDVEDWIAEHEPIPDVRLAADELAVLMYTGGTTGRPKGVMLSGRNILTSAMGVHIGVGIENCPQRHLTVSLLFHLAAFGNIYAQALLGSTLIQSPGFDVAEFAQTIEDHKVTSINVVPTMIARLLDYLGEHECDLSSLKIIGYGAAAIAPLLLERLREVLPDVELSQRLGMTETGPSTTILTPADHRGDVRLLGSVGRAAVHAEIRIVDGEDNDVPLGEVGELIVRGDHVMLGYWRQPELTAHVLRGGWMHTGDAGRMDADGYLFLVDRIKDMIITGGENVYSAEVENIIIRHPAVARVAVIGAPDTDWGERVHAVIVPEPGQTVDLDDIRAFAADHLARYKLPKSLQLIDALPLSAAGKVLKRQLREDCAG
jgi:acyl-CoA synthetase (AMP-forming)/AMP-acid ligase II